MEQGQGIDVKPGAKSGLDTFPSDDPFASGGISVAMYHPKFLSADASMHAMMEKDPFLPSSSHTYASIILGGEPAYTASSSGPYSGVYRGYLVIYAVLSMPFMVTHTTGSAFSFPSFLKSIKPS
jgi:hypothetical protein